MSDQAKQTPNAGEVDTPPTDLVIGPNSRATKLRDGRWKIMPKGRLGGFGRQKGTPNRATSEMKDALRRFLEDADYQANLMFRIEAGQADHMERYFWELVYGKPKQTIELERQPRSPLASMLKLMSEDELAILYDAAKRYRQATAQQALGQVGMPIPVTGKVVKKSGKARPPKD